MMRKNVLRVWLLLTGCILSAATVKLDGNFTKLDAQSMPQDWVQHRNWDGFKPFAKLEIKKYGSFNALHIFDTQAKYGVCVRTANRIKGLSGDTVTITLRARGKGTAWVALYYYTRQGGWNRTSESRTFKLTNDWSEQRFSFVLNNAGEGETGFYDVTFGGEHGLDGEFTNVKVTQEEGKFRGNNNFPTKWVVFAPMNAKFTPSAADLTTLPKMLGGVKGQDAMLQGNRFDLARFTKGHRENNCVWAFAELNSPIECDYTLGAGADWWMTGYLNGKKFVDTSESGNGTHPYTIANHVRTVRLKKGENLFAFRIVTGKASSVFAVGGPDDLRQMRTHLKVNKVLRSDDYDDPKAERIGNPAHIVGNPTPGLLSATGQGVYTTTGRVPIRFASTIAKLPDHASEYFAAGVRIQNFGRLNRQNSELDFVFRAGEDSFVLTLRHDGKSPDIELIARDRKKEAGTFSIPYKMLPADVLVGANRDGEYAVNIDSLSESSNRTFRGKAEFFRSHRAFDAELVFRSSGGNAEIVVDNLIHGIASAGEKGSGVPFVIDLDKEFDPVKAGWKLVFADEFNGSELDRSKWYFASYRNGEKYAKLDGKGKLHILADMNQEGKLETASLWSQEKFKYGYFESRLKFTRQPGWWAAFWLYGDTNSNPMIDGFEIDIFEDYYTRPTKTGEPFRKIIDHNLHVYTGSVLKSWNYNSTLPGSLDDFYVLGCKWTPFEITYYLNGKLLASSANHSPYSSVTFDAVNHALATAPIHAIVSGQIMSDSWFSKAKDGKFPEAFEVDYVRVYAYPQHDAPSVRWSVKNDELMVPEGSELKFAVEAKPSAKTKAPIKAAYLFDSGYLIAHKTEPPFEFTIPFTSQFYAATRYTRPGRSGKKPVFADNPHVFAVFVQDENGKAAHTDTVMKLVRSPKKSTPYLGKAQTIPGRINPCFYDEGGQNTAYSDTTPKNLASKTFRVNEGVDAGGTSIGNVTSGEWMNYTVDIAREGTYRAALRYGTPMGGRHAVLMMLDGKLIGTFELKKHDNPDWGCDSVATLENIKLPKGRHVITLLLIGGFNLAEIDFSLMKK